MINFENIKKHPNFPKFLSHLNKFIQLGGNVTHILPMLSDYDEQAGITSGHYFHQDLLVAGFIYSANPIRHIDIGSRIDGLVAHIASFRKIELCDIRDLPDTGHPNISFIKIDLMKDNESNRNITDSISCLHAIEHFGLGRYGDSIDPLGHIKGFQNIVRLLKPDGTLYISFPISGHNEVHFNAHRVFNPTDVLTWIEDSSSLKLERFDYVDDAGKLRRSIELKNEKFDVDYGCGIYTFRKRKQ
jgi:hypothetical protein